ncbi:MAG: zinc ribbon domain-containing protein [Oscillospiraceae bacterium]|nr:zinc ribbon domain-containing protein [Oscillospiraceae bacterium]
MICKNCGTECPDGNLFCDKCGAELETSVLPDNIDSKGRIITGKKGKEKAAPDDGDKPKREKAHKREKIQLTEGQKAARRKTLRGIGIAAAVIVVVVVIAVVVNLINANKGYTYATKVPVGRNVDYARSETGLDFVKRSDNGMINSMTDFDYICISDKKVRISGSEQPEWAIFLTTDSEDMITDVEFYDFTQLKLNWKGNKSDAMLTENDLTYGMSIKNVNKTLGLKPYYLKRSVSNDSVYCYRYYYTDEEAGYDRAYNYYVDFSETELQVRSVSYCEIEYAKVILNVNTNMPVLETEPVDVQDEETDGSEEDTAEDADTEDTSDITE